jgi:hypothetical protein
LSTQTDTTTVAFPGVTENDLLWAGVCPGHLGRIFQALSTQTDTTTVAFPGVTENDLLWAGVCPGRLGRIFQALPTQTDTIVALIYKILNQSIPPSYWCFCLPFHIPSNERSESLTLVKE